MDMRCFVIGFWSSSLEQREEDGGEKRGERVIDISDFERRKNYHLIVSRIYKR